MLSRRRITRLLSVEICYSSYFSDLVQSELIKRVLDLHDVSYMREYDPEMLNSLLMSCLANADTDTQLIGRFLSSEWKIDRVDHIKLSVLRVALSELRVSKAEQKNLVINEYVDLANLFLSVKEVGFINAMLDKLAVEVQGGLI